MIQNAIDKIKNEMNQSNSDSYTQVVGELLTKHIKKNPEAAEKVLAEGKTIAKSFEAMRKEAEKKKKGNFAMLTLEEGFKVVLEYFDINGKVTIINQDPLEAVEVKNTSPKGKKINFDVNLDDLL